MVLVFDTVNNVFQLLHVGGLLLDDSVYRCFEGGVEDVGCVVHRVMPFLRYRLACSMCCLRIRLTSSVFGLPTVSRFAG